MSEMIEDRIDEEDESDESIDIPSVDIAEFDKIVQGAIDLVDIVWDQDEEVNLTGPEHGPIVRLINGILLNAAKRKVSDIHIEPYRNAYRVRYRMDGVLHQVMGLPIQLKNAMTSRIKVMAQLNIAKKHCPQKGRIILKTGKRKETVFRVSIIPTVFGEAIVLRLLHESNVQCDLAKLGLDPESLETFREAIHNPYGMVLLTGPKGSGKTTTLHSALWELDSAEVNIMTLEDPVEFNRIGFNQVQVHEKTGFDFVTALRALLEHDPDVIMVDELRDVETAEISMNAVLHGLRVFSTVPAKDAPSTIQHLIMMGVKPFLVASSVSLIVAQRLVHRLCECKQPQAVPDERSHDDLIRAGYSPEEARDMSQIWEPKGCRKCFNSGYHGRIALYEVMRMSPALCEMVLQGASPDKLRIKAEEQGMLTLRKSGLQKVRDGITSLEEVVRATPDH